jgi:putative methionine-R-sulfoxide reductase with GAF domain
MQPFGNKPADLSRELNPSTRDRRRCVRQRVHTPAYASLDGNSSGMVLDLSEILDISEEGMSVQNSAPLEVNRSLSLCLDLSETKTYIPTTGHVVWSHPSGRSGIRFPGMQQASLRQLKEWLFLNAISACINHAARMPEAVAESLEKPQEEATAEPAAGPEREFEPSAPPDYTSVLAALTAIRREVEAKGSDLSAALRLVAERAQAFTGATGAAIALSQGNEMICVASSGPDSPRIGTQLQVGSGFSGECVGTGRLLRCDDSETDSRVDRESCRALGIRSMVAVPIRLGDAIVGLLEMFSRAPNAFVATDHTVLQRLAETILAAVSRAAHVSDVKSRTLEPSARTVEDQPAARLTPELVTFESTTPDEAPSRRFPKILLAAAAATLVMALLWLGTPGIRSRINGPRRQGLPPQPKVSKRPVMSATEAGSLEGLRSLAEQGDPTAQFALGARYATGEDVKQNYAEAARWFALAAEQGHVVAQATLGAYYWAGRGVPLDLGKAYFWSILAQAGGDEASKYRVAVLASRMTRGQILAAQQRANEWLKQHQLTSTNPQDSQ